MYYNFSNRTFILIHQRFCSLCVEIYTPSIAVVSPNLYQNNCCHRILLPPPLLRLQFQHQLLHILIFSHLHRVKQAQRPLDRGMLLLFLNAMVAIYQDNDDASVKFATPCCNDATINYIKVGQRLRWCS